jgi:hypothetical protein
VLRFRKLELWLQEVELELENKIRGTMISHGLFQRKKNPRHS